MRCRRFSARIFSRGNGRKIFRSHLVCLIYDDDDDEAKTEYNEQRSIYPVSTFRRNTQLDFLFYILISIYTFYVLYIPTKSEIIGVNHDISNRQFTAVPSR